MKNGLFYFLPILLLWGCNNVTIIGPMEEDKAICQENMDTLLSHIHGWEVINQSFSSVLLDTYTNNKNVTKVYEYVLYASVTDGNDTISLACYPHSQSFNYDINEFEDAWSGTVFNAATSLDSIETIKRGNFALKRLCGDDEFFRKTIQDNVLQVEFIKFKPQKVHTPSDYGLDSIN